MQTPSILLGLLISTLYGAAFHLWRGGGAGRLLLYLILSWVGFWAGQILSSFMDWSFFSLGQLHLGVATISSLLFLLVGQWLSLIEIDRQDTP
jgi:hypothetical protein